HTREEGGGRTPLTMMLISFMDVLLAGPKYTLILAHLMPSGGVHSTGYAAYNRMGKDRGANDAMTLAGCWAHARRKFFDLHASDSSPFASAVVKAMAPLWVIEEDIRG